MKSTASSQLEERQAADNWVNSKREPAHPLPWDCSSWLETWRLDYCPIQERDPEKQMVILSGDLFA